MRVRYLVILITCLAVIGELTILFGRPDPTKKIPNGKDTLFGNYDIVVDYDKKKSDDNKIYISIFATLAIGTITTFVIPQHKRIG